MAFTLTQLAAIEAAMATGELSVEFEGKKVVYRSIESLREARDLVRAELIASGALTDSTPRMSYATFTKG